MIHLKLISEHASHKPQAPAFVDAQFSMSWAQFKRETEHKITFLLDHYGTQLPRQASYITTNRLDLMPWLAAFSTLGIAYTGLDYTLPSATLKALNTAIDADFVLVSTASVSQLTDPTACLPASAMLFDLDSLAAPFIDHPIEGDVMERLAQMPLAPRPFRSIGFTSGTTGVPKLVLRHESFDQRRFAYFSQKYRFSGKDKFLSIMPTYHAAGNGWMRLFLSLGASIHICPAHAETEWLQMMAESGITASVMTPVLLTRLLDQARQSPEQLAPHLRWLLVGGRHFAPTLKLRAIHTLGPCLYEYYGTTETGVNTIAEPQDIVHHADSVGKAYDGNTVRIVDGEGRPLPAMKEGRIVVDSYMNMASYGDSDGDGAAPSLELDGKHYLITPDKGYMDEQGRLFLLNRSDSPANHINLYRLEDSIRSLPDIKDVAILSSAGQGREETTCALSVKQGYQPSQLLFEKVFSLAAQEDVTFDCCHVLPSIPYTPSGKVRLRDLNTLTQAGA